MPESDDAPDDPQQSHPLPTYLWRLSKEVIITLILVAAIAGVLFAYTGLWPPFVSIISGSMEPDLERGDLVMIVDNDRVDAPDEHAYAEIVPHDRGDKADVTTFGKQGHVIVFTPNGTRTEHNIIHRAMFYVEEGENWTDRANPEYTHSMNCDYLDYCPAPHDGFITKGDANSEYDQTSDISGPVPVEDINGVAKFEIPYAGHLHLLLDNS